MDTVLMIILAAAFVAAAVFGVLVDNGHFVSDRKKGDKKDAQ